MIPLSTVVERSIRLDHVCLEHYVSGKVNFTPESPPIITTLLKFECCCSTPYKSKSVRGVMIAPKGCRMELLQHPKGVNLHSTPIEVLH